MRSAAHRPRRIAAAVLAALCGTAMAADPGAAPEVAADATVPEPSSPGFVWRPQISLTPTYDDNIYALPSDTIADWVWVVSPTLSAESQWDTHRIRLDAGLELARYDDYTSEDYDDWWVNADGRYDLAPGSNLFGGIGFSQEHEERGSPDAVAPAETLAAIPAEPTVYTTLTAQGGVVQRFGGYQLRAGATFERLDYDDVPGLAGSTIDSDYRDRRVLGVSVRLSRALDDRRDLFAQAQWNERRYDETPDAYGYLRDSDGYRLAVGLKGQLGRGLEAEGYLGYLRQDYDDPRFDTVDGLDFAGKINWRAGPRTGVRLTLERTVYETTLAGSSSYLYTNLGGSLAHQLDDRTTLNANLGAGLVAYQDVGRDDWIYLAGLSARYQIVPQVYLTAGYRWVRRDSNEGGDAFFGADPFDYDRQQLYLTLSVLDSF